MRPTETEQTLIQIIDSRSDTGFHGSELTKSKFTKHYDDDELVQDEAGNYYSHRHDYIRFKSVDGERVGVLVADRDGRNCMDHSDSDLPHPIGLYVREPYRSQGIATELLDEFMHTVDADTCVIHCEVAVMPFYMQLDWNIIFLSHTEPPIVEIDTSATSEHGIPVLEPDSQELEQYIQQCTQRQEPAVYVSIADSVAKGRVPSSHDLSAEPPMRHYTSSRADQELCKVVINLENLAQGVSIDAMNELQQTPADLCVDYVETGRRAWMQRHDTEIIETWAMPPSAAKEVGDAAYSLLSEEDSLHPDGSGFALCR